MGNRSTRKSGHNSGTFKPGRDPRRGRGPAKGAPNAGRPPDAIRATARTEVDRGVGILSGFLADPSLEPDIRIRAFQALLKTSGMERIEHTGQDGVALPPMRVIIEGGA